MKPSVSVCMATYNGEKYIGQQILSILQHIDKNDELIISDDGSTDATISIINAIDDKRIKLVKNTGTHGYTSNFENALKHSSNDVIFLSDQDDIWEPDKVAVCIKYLKRYDFVVHDATVVDSENRLISKSYYDQRTVYKSWIGNLIKFGYLGCCMAFNRAVMQRSLPFPENRTLCTHDNWLFLIARSYYRVGILNEKLIRYRRHGLNTSSGGRKSSLKLFFMLKYRLYLILQLWQRLRLK